MKVLRWMLVVVIGIIGLFVMRSMLGFLLTVLVVVVDVIMAAGLYIHCDGSCRRNYGFYFENYLPIIRRCLIVFFIVFTLTFPPVIATGITIFLCVYVGWFNLNYWVARSYIKNDHKTW